MKEGIEGTLNRLLPQVEAKLGASAIKWHSIPRGLPNVERYVIQLDNGSSVFVKLARDERAAEDLRKEDKIYRSISADFMPRVLGWIDGNRPILIMEDLGDALWPPPWSEESLKAASTFLEQLSQTKAPDFLPPTSLGAHTYGGWQKIQEDRYDFGQLAVAPEQWLKDNINKLVEAEQQMQRELDDGDSLVHGDMHSKNLCFIGGHAIGIDWNHATRGNSRVDETWLRLSMAIEGGPTTVTHPELSAPFVAGIIGRAAHLAANHNPRTPEAIRKIRIAFVKAGLDWIKEYGV